MTTPISHLPPDKQKRALLVEQFLMFCQEENIVLAELDGDKTFPLSIDAQGEVLVKWVEKSEEGL